MFIMRSAHGMTKEETAGESMFDVAKIAKHIRELRISKNMTQMNLADELGVSYQAVSNWERGGSLS